MPVHLARYILFRCPKTKQSTKSGNHFNAADHFLSPFLAILVVLDHITIPQIVRGAKWTVAATATEHAVDSAFQDLCVFFGIFLICSIGFITDILPLRLYLHAPLAAAPFFPLSWFQISFACHFSVLEVVV
jgi:hypothetical protein